MLYNIEVIKPSKYSRKKQSRMTEYSQQGFTLIELIVTMALGLIISAAALQIFLTSSQSKNSQQASSQIQDNVIFGINQITKHIRRANFGAQSNNENSGFVLNYDTPQGGIVLTAPKSEPEVGETSSLDGLNHNGQPIDANLLSRDDDSESNLANLKNDQLTIQYQMPLEGQFDCQGREIPKDYYVIERYFVRDDDGRKSLACASTNYKYDEELVENNEIDISKYTKPSLTTANAQFDGKGSVIIPNVDYFRVLYGITSDDNFALNPDEIQIRYTPVGNNPASTFAGRRIVSVQLGLLIASESAISSSQENSDLEFNILDKRDVKLTSNAASGSKYLRETYESTVLIRNGRGRD